MTQEKTDPQCQSLYQWEDDWLLWNRNTHSLPVLRKIIRVVCKLYKVTAPAVSGHKNKQYSYYLPGRHSISLQGGKKHRYGGRNPATALHEAAHHIAGQLHGKTIQDHGPTFLRIYLDLLERARVAPRIALEATARSHSLKWR